VRMEEEVVVVEAGEEEAQGSLVDLSQHKQL
jgi:hypothetical protein